MPARSPCRAVEPEIDLGADGILDHRRRKHVGLPAPSAVAFDELLAAAVAWFHFDGEAAEIVGVHLFVRQTDANEYGWHAEIRECFFPGAL